MVAKKKAKKVKNKKAKKYQGASFEVENITGHAKLLKLEDDRIELSVAYIRKENPDNEYKDSVIFGDKGVAVSLGFLMSEALYQAMLDLLSLPQSFDDEVFE